MVWDNVVTAPTLPVRVPKNLRNKSSALEKDPKISLVLFQPGSAQPHTAVHDQGTFTRKLEWCPFAHRALAEALLRVIAMLWSNLADIVRMRPSRPLSDWHTEAAPASLPQQDRDPIKETEAAAPTSQPHEVLMLRAPKGRVSKHEDGLTAASHTLAHQGDCHPGSAKRYPGPIPQHRDSQTHGSRLSSAHALAAGMTTLGIARFQDSSAPS